MKKIIALSAAALLCGAISLSAKTADELRIYLNPGHGSWSPNDRPQDIIREIDGNLTVVKTGAAAAEESFPDTTAFYETNTNLRKVFAIVDKLEGYGIKFDRTKNQDNPNPARQGAALDLTNNIVMSHVKAGPYPCVGVYTTSWSFPSEYNRGLSEICEEVELNNFDMFISVHSNAATDGSTVNYPAIFYRGYYTNEKAEGKRAANDSPDTPDFAAGSIDMAKAAAQYVLNHGHMHWTARKTDAVGNGCVIGDAEFQGGGSVSTRSNGNKYHGYYGVLKHGVPGYLVEGYFHTYQPARLRSMNFDACRIEGIQYARGVADYFGLAKESTGDIFGVVRDKKQKFSHNLYNPQGNTNDAYLPLNGVTVILKKDGEEVARVETDNQYNGAWVFKNVEPGKYTVEFEKDGYVMDTDEDALGEFEVKAAMTTYPEAWMIDENWTPPAVVYYDYDDPLAEVGSVAPADEYEMAQAYTDEAAEALDGLNVRRTIARDGKLYILAYDAENNATITVQDVVSREVLATVSTEGATAGNVRAIGDIALSADSRIVAINADNNQAFGGGAKIYLYTWENDENGLPTGDPVSMGTYNHAGNWNNAEFGKTMTYVGTIASGKMIFANKSAASASTRIEIYAIEDGKFTSGYHNNFNKMAPEADFTDAALGDFQFNVSPLNEDALIITAENHLPFEIKLNGASAGVPTLIGEVPAGVIEGNGFRSSFFKMAGGVFMVAPATNEEGVNVGVQLVNVTDGLSKARLVATTNTELPVEETPSEKRRAWAEVGAGVASANGYANVVKTAEGAYKSHSVELVLTRKNGQVSRFTSEGVEQPLEPASFAYDLNMTKADDIYTLTFKSNGAAPAGKVILTNVADASDVRTYEFGEVRFGLNEVEVDATELAADAAYNWSVEIASKAIPQAKIVYNESLGGNVGTRGSMVVMSDPEQPSFGKIVKASGFAKGITVYSPDLTNLGTFHANAPTMAASNGSSLMRGTEREGKVIFVDWSDAGAGYWQFDPENPETELVNILAGTHESSGRFMYEGKAIGGGATGIKFVGKGEDEKMYVFCEDYPTGNAGNYIIRYSSAGSPIINMYPDQIWNGSDFGEYNTKSLYANTNVEINAVEQGLIFNQNRGIGSNSKGCPSIEIYGYDGTRYYNSGASEDDTWISTSGGCAITPDGEILAVPSWGKGIDIFRVSWAGKETSLTHLYNIAAPSGGTSAEYTQMAFDPAGNLLAFDRKDGLKKFVLVNTKPVATTPARKALVINGAPSGVEDVIVDQSNDTNAPVEYFNLQGQRVYNPAAGTIVIRRQGNTATKIVVK